ncbi:GyrI-like domain-containing protein [Flavobacterium sp.]|uniref:GyrI-like domain-containing protein n=1 Tax=Flavobacterium sp. TaxID=239 RepID=UPI0039E69A60
MEMRFAFLPSQKLIGHCQRQSLTDDRTLELWRKFMPRRNEIAKAINTNELVSMRIYGPEYDFNNFNPSAEFDKWAGRFVSDFDQVPDGMQIHTIPEGHYAVFLYQGSPQNAAAAFGYIFESWLPQSGYELDARPHFEILGEKYRNDSEDSQEEIWVPIKRRP